MVQQLGVMTAVELLAYRNEPYRHELIDGRLHEMEPHGARHGLVALEIGARIREHVGKHDLGRVFGAETGFRLASDPDTVRAPDAAFVSRPRVEAGGIPDGYWPGPPDLAVEVVSPSDRHREVEAKALGWMDAGARVVVVLDPRRSTAAVYRARDDIRVLEGQDPIDLDDVLPGFAPRGILALRFGEHALTEPADDSEALELHIAA